MLSAFVPKTTTIYVGLRVPEKPTTLKNEDLDDLIGAGQWKFDKAERTHLAEHEAEIHIAIEQAWGTVRAFPGDYILRGEGGVSVLPPTVFRSLKLTEIKA